MANEIVLQRMKTFYREYERYEESCNDIESDASPNKAFVAAQELFAVMSEELLAQLEREQLGRNDGDN